MACNFVTTVSRLMLITSGKFVAHLFPALKENLGCYKFKDDREVKRFVTRWKLTEDKDRHQQRTETLAGPTIW